MAKNQKPPLAGRKAPDRSRAESFVRDAKPDKSRQEAKMHQPKPARKATTFHMDQELAKRVKLRAVHEGTQPVHVVERALKEYLDKVED